MSELFGIHDLDYLEGQITGWLLDMKTRNETIAAVDRGEKVSCGHRFAGCYGVVTVTRRVIDGAALIQHRYGDQV